MPRLDLLIAHNLGFSRGVVTRLCRQGRVSTPEGAPLRDPALQIPPAGLPMAIQLDDAPHTLYLRYHLLQHKPLGVVTALRDDRHATAYDLLKSAPLRRPSPRTCLPYQSSRTKYTGTPRCIASSTASCI